MADTEAVLELINGSDSEIDGLDDDDLDSDPACPMIRNVMAETQSDEEQSDEEEAGSSNMTDDVPVVSTSKKKNTIIWKQENFTETYTESNASYDRPASIGTPLEYFEKYLSSDHFESAALYTNMYSMSTKNKELKTTPKEIKVLYGAHFIFGCLPYPQLHMYWRKGISLDTVASVISRDRFKTLRMCLHYVDVQTPPENHGLFWKVDPLINSVRNRCLSLPRKTTDYSVDEQMIPFTGKLPPGLRQYVKNKPRPVGLKNFVVTTSSGLVMDFEIYQGKQIVCCSKIFFLTKLIFRNTHSFSGQDYRFGTCGGVAFDTDTSSKQLHLF